MINDSQPGRGTPELEELLDTIHEFGAASLGLIAWDLWLPEEELLTVWLKAIYDGLIQQAGPCPDTGEVMYTLSARGKRARMRIVGPREAGLKPPPSR
jgi:hypothetical protein